MGRFINSDILVSTGQGILGNNMFAYCLNSPTNGCDPCGTCFHNWSFEDCPECAEFWTSVKAGWNTFSNSVQTGWNAFSQCFGITGEIGYGFGAKGKLGAVSLDATVIILGDEWTYNTDGTHESARKSSISLQAELIDNVSLGVDCMYSVPIAEGKKYGLLGAKGGEFDATVGAYAYSYGLGYNTIDSKDIEISFGASAYLVMGGGFEVSFNLSQFIELLR